MALAVGLLLALSAPAQTLRGQSGLSGSPVPFEASVYPILTELSALKVSFNNPSGNRVWVNIRDAKGWLVYSEPSTGRQYRGHLDLSAMPAGQYSLELRYRTGSFTQPFVIEPAAPGHIALISRQVPPMPDTPSATRLTINH